MAILTDGIAPHIMLKVRIFIPRIDLKMKKSLRVFIALAAISIILIRCDSSVSRRPRPNIVLITLDTVRADHLSCYGYKKKTTPHIDNIAEEGLLFKSAVAPSSWTIPTHASIFTGLSPSEHNARYNLKGEFSIFDMPFNKLSDDNLTLAEILRDNGYKTFGVVGGPCMSGEFGFKQGFDDYIHEFRNGAYINRAVEELLSKHKKRPFFLFLNYFDPHALYDPPAPFNLQFATSDYSKRGLKPDMYLTAEDEIMAGKRSLTPEEKRYFTSQYDGEIAFMDSCIGKIVGLLKEKGLYDKTLFILAGDHGENFGEHNIINHGNALYQETQHVPLIIKFPADKESQEGIMDHPVAIADIFYFLLNHLKITPPREPDYAPFSREERPIYAELYPALRKIKRYGDDYNRDLYALYYGGYKLIWSSKGTSELYNLREDPHETVNMISNPPPEYAALKDMLIAWIQSRPGVKTTGADRVDPETKQLLRSLGYIE